MAHTEGRTSHDTHPTASPALGAMNGTNAASRPPARVTLRRLLGLATLTPTQAVHIAGEVLGLLDGAAGTDTDGVAIDQDGSVRLLAGHTRRREVSRTAELIDQLTHNADRPVARRNPASAALLTALTRCAAALRDSDLVAARAALVSATQPDGLDGRQAKRELAALVAVPLRPSVGLPKPPVIERTPARSEPRPTPVGPQQVRPTTSRRRRRVITTIVIAALAVIGVISTIALVRPGGSGTNGTPTTAPTTSAHGGASGSHHRNGHGRTHHRTIPRLAPAQARAISRVTLTPVARCHRGTSCTVTVRVWLRPPWLSTFHWHASAVNRCTGRVQRIGSGSMIAGRGWRSAYATVQIPVPDKRRLALIAVVDKPVSAASRPLLVGTRRCG